MTPPRPQSVLAPSIVIPIEELAQLFDFPESEREADPLIEWLAVHPRLWEVVSVATDPCYE